MLFIPYGFDRRAEWWCLAIFFLPPPFPQSIFSWDLYYLYRRCSGKPFLVMHSEVFLPLLRWVVVVAPSHRTDVFHKFVSSLLSGVEFFDVEPKVQMSIYNLSHSTLHCDVGVSYGIFMHSISIYYNIIILFQQNILTLMAHIHL
jgi:hypothetical protein